MEKFVVGLALVAFFLVGCDSRSEAEKEFDEYQAEQEEATKGLKRAFDNLNYTSELDAKIEESRLRFEKAVLAGDEDEISKIEKELDELIEEVDTRLEDK